jgi:ubiquinone/menaquinone biosynthesis C-methylase UbiE
MDMCHLTFPDASFKGIWCSSSLLHVPQALAPDALGQMRRVLVKAGMLFLSLLEGESEMWESEASEFALSSGFLSTTRKPSSLLTSRMQDLCQLSSIGTALANMSG